MKKAALIFGLVLSMAAIGAGQVRTVTNSSLQKFQEKRLAAERDYRENYARLGFPSPEDLDRQRETDMAARLSLVVQLREARLEKERLELERNNLELDTIRLDSETDYYAPANGFYGQYFGGFRSFGGFNSGRGYRRFRRHFPSGNLSQRNRLLPYVDRRGAYRVTPFEVIPVPNPRSPRIVLKSGRRH